VPLIVINGAPPAGRREAGALVHHLVSNYYLQLDIYRKITADAAILTDPGTAPDEIDRVIQSCISRKLPVYLELPADMTNMPCRAPAVIRFDNLQASDAESLEECVAEAAKLLNESGQPIILAGVELNRFGLGNETLSLVEASEEDLEQARQFGFPTVLLDLYRVAAPDAAEGRIELWKNRPASGQRVWSVQNAITENRDYVPGTYLFRLGYVVFASNMFGDAYCIDTVHVSGSGDMPVVLFPHDVIEEGASLEDVEPYRLPVAADLEDFLQQFVGRTLVEEAKYA